MYWCFTIGYGRVSAINYTFIPDFSIYICLGPRSSIKCNLVKILVNVLLNAASKMNNYSGLSLFFLTGSTVAMRKVQSIFLIEGGTYSCSTREGKKIYGTESNVSPRLLFV